MNPSSVFLTLRRLSRILSAVLVPFFVGVSAQSDDSREEINKIVLIAQTEVTRLQAGREVYSWEFLTVGKSLPHYCSGECACLASHISAAILRAHPQSQLKIINLRPVNSYGVTMISMDNRFKENFDYHEAVEITIDGQAMVIDPILMGLPIKFMLPASEWIKHFANYIFGYLN